MIHRMAAASPVYETPLARGVKLGDTPAGEVVRLSIQPGGEIPPHRLPMTVLFYIAAGQGRLMTDAGPEHLGMGDLVSLDGGLTRGWQNPGPGTLDLLVIKLK